MSEGNLSSSSPIPPAGGDTDANLESAGATPLPPDLIEAVRGAQAKQAEDLRIFDLRGVTSLTEYFLICGGTNQRQNQAISDEIERRLKEPESRKRLPLGVEGYDKADWILMDYGDFIVHIFSGQARKYYDLERLWRQAKECAVPPEELPAHLASGAVS
ncbi:MAG: ribosome silencing factor [Bryobacterales bacterium]|nr:ribosome silencing factor [Bryobacterales bacterium]